MGSLGLLSLCAVASALSFSTLTTKSHVDRVSKTFQPQNRVSRDIIEEPGSVVQPKPCQLYAPGLVEAALPTVVSVRPPTSVWWSVHLLLVSEGNTMACITLSRATTDVQAELFTGKCGKHSIDTYVIPRNYIKIDWFHIKVETFNTLKIFIIIPREERTIFFLDKFLPPANMSLIVEAVIPFKTKFDCPSACNIEEVPHSSELRLYKQFYNNFSFNIMPESHLTELQEQFPRCQE
nr:uncharacterized protein LOC123745262 [Procambarus clarkii]